MNHIIDALNWRYATKKFDSSKKLTDEQYNDLKEVLRLTPSSFGLQPWKFVIVRDQELKDKLVAASYNQTQVADCDALVVLCGMENLDSKLVENFIQDMIDTRQAPAEALEGYKQHMLGFIGNTPDDIKKGWAARQLYIALGNAMTALADMKIDSCPMEGFEANKYNEILGLGDKGLTSVLVLPIGFRSSDDETAGRKKVRYSQEELIIEM